MTTKADAANIANIAKIKPRWEGNTPKCCCLVLGEPPFAGPDGCDFFHVESAPREPTEESCQFPGLETKCQSMGHCNPAIAHLMIRKK